MICSKCNKDLQEMFLDCSHDIPKYMEGSDRDKCRLIAKEIKEEFFKDA